MPMFSNLDALCHLTPHYHKNTQMAASPPCDTVSPMSMRHHLAYVGQAWSYHYKHDTIDVSLPITKVITYTKPTTNLVPKIPAPFLKIFTLSQTD